jgi:hypothetical protein
MSRLALYLVLAGAVAGCTGYVDGDVNTKGAGATTGNDPSPGAGSGGSATGVDPEKPPSGQVTCTASNTETVGHRVLRRLTNLELETSLRATLGLDAAKWPGVNLPSDAGSLDGFTNNVDSLTVSPQYAKDNFDGAKKIAALVSADPQLSTLAPCSATGDAACADTFVASLGAKLYRRPLSATEKGRYSALYTKISADSGDFKSFAYWATIAMLQSPHLIYRSEIGEPEGARFKLTPYEIATQLAYTFTGAPPSDALTQLAASNQLATADQIEAAARSLVFDGQAARPAFRDVLLRFSEQWLGLAGFSNIKKDATLYPDFNEEVQASMAEETRKFFSSVVLEDKGTVANLYTAPYTFVDSKLAGYYGFGTASGSDFVRAMRPANWGVGLLAQGALLATQANSLTTSPTRRGYLVRTKLLCGTVPPPPAVVGEIPAPSAAKTTRQRYEELHTANPSCKACHSMMDNIGFSLEHLDSAGRFRETENNNPINDDGIVTGTTAGDLTVDGAAGLATALSTLPDATDCMSSYMAAYALGVNHENAACLVSTAKTELQGGSSLIDFYIRIARAEHFRTRQ